MILDGKLVSNKIQEEIKEFVNNLENKPGLAVIQVGDNPASTIYIKNKRKMAEKLGIEFFHFKFDEDITEDTIINRIIKLNKDNNIDGIIVQLPLPNHLDEKVIINSIDPNKDVDGLTTTNYGKLFNNQDAFVSCTPNGIIKLLEYYNIEIEGKHVVIIGRSNLVGKPLIELFLRKNATVTICHSKTVNLKNFTKLADILVVATGKKHLVKKNMVKNDSIIIDVGITKENDKIYGDVDFASVAKKTKYISPVPGGVGPMTVIMLFANTIKNKREF